MFSSETQAVQYLQDLLRYREQCFVQKVSLRYTSGFPDIIVGYQGGVAFYEVKIVKNDSLRQSLASVKPIQNHTISMMRKAGLNASVLIFNNRDIVYHFVKDESLYTISNFKTAFQKDPLLLAA